MTVTSSTTAGAAVGVIACVDIGGTFTDAVTYDQSSGTVRTGKALTTYGALEQGIIGALEAAGFTEMEALEQLRHGSTIVINALLERKGSRTAVITTRGFADVLFIGRGNVPVPYTLDYRRLPPYTERELVFEADERTAPDGEIEIAPTAEGVAALAEKISMSGCESVAIAFLNSYQNPENEQFVQRELARGLPGVYISCSTDISREWHEWERTSSAVMNAYVGPTVKAYLDRVVGTLQSRGANARVFATDSTGGLMSLERARERPIYMVESGPAAGALAAVETATGHGFDRVVTLDMGGTTAKSAVAVRGELGTVRVYWVDGYEHGWPVQCPTLDLMEIGAGGGSIAWTDEVGALHVGPRSAGSNPGPAAYALGGIAPTVTDAHVHLGNIPLSSGESSIIFRQDLATAALERLAATIGLDADRLALGILDIADAKMAALLRAVTARRGYDPRDFVLVAFGGSGPLHATSLARELGIRDVLIPPEPGVYSAYGMLFSDIRVDLSRIFVGTLDMWPERLDETWRALEADGQAQLDGIGDADAPIRHIRSLDGRYHGQDHVINLTVPNELPDSVELRRLFDDRYAELYGHFDNDSTVEITNLRVTSLKSAQLPAGEHAHSGGSSAGAAASDDWIDKASCRVGDIIIGPRIVLDKGSTIRLLAGDRAELLEDNHLRISVGVQ